MCIAYTEGFEEGEENGKRQMKVAILREIQDARQSWRTAANLGNDIATSIRKVLGELAEKIEGM